MSKAIQDSPTLSQFKPSIAFNIIEIEVFLVQKFRRSVIFPMIIFYCFFAFITATFPSNNFLIFTLVNLLANFMLLCAVRILILAVMSQLYERIAVDRFVEIIRLLERNKEYWQDTQFRWAMAKRLERSALAIERIPSALRGVAPSAKREAYRLSQRKSQAIRNIEISIITPESSTQSAIIDRMVDSIHFVINGEWYKLPEADYERYKSRTLIIGASIGAVLSLAVAVALVALASKIGPIASLFSPLLLGASIALLNMAGLPLNIIDRYVQEGRNIVPGDSKN